MSEILLDFVDQLVGDDENVLDLFLGSNDRNNNNNDKNNNANIEAPPSSTTDMQAWLSSVNTNEDTNETDAAAGGTLLSLPPVEDYCTMPTELFDANYTGQVEPFQNTSVIHWMHTIPPRFGQTNKSPLCY